MTKVLLFGAEEWCPSCRKMKPVFEETAKEMSADNISFESVEVESDRGVELSDKYHVMNVPTILVVKDEQIMERIVGTHTKQQLVAIFEKWK